MARKVEPADVILLLIPLGLALGAFHVSGVVLAYVSTLGGLFVLPLTWRQ